MVKLVNILKEKNISSLVSNITVAGAGFASFLLLTRQLDPEDFGRWVLFVTLASFVDLLRFGLTNTATVRQLSHARPEDEKMLLASSYFINILVLAAIAIVCYGILLILSFIKPLQDSGYVLFLRWYPLLGLLNLSWNSACALFQARQQFVRMMYVRLCNVGLFVLFLGFNLFFFHLDLLTILGVYLTANGLSSLLCIVQRWDGLRYLRLCERETVKKLVDFGKYSMGTLIGSSLLKSADTFIIGLNPILGSTAIAMYAIPLKLTDLLGIPLRSLAMTAYPKISRKILSGDAEGARATFYAYSGAITLAFVPVAAASFVFAEELILLLGGSAYQDQLAVLTVVFKIFTVYTVLLPIDRFTGIMLDSVNRPKLNLNKVLMMTLANVIIDLIGVFVFDSLIVVALGTVGFTIAGIFLGFYFLNKAVQVQFKNVFPESLKFLRNLNTIQFR